MNAPRAAARLRFTLALAATLCAVALASGTVLHRLPDRLLAVVGFAPSDLAGGGGALLTIASSALFTGGGTYFFRVLLLIALPMVGACEWRQGWRPSVTVFVVGHVAVLLLFSGVVAAAGRVGFDPLARLWDVKDVGPSAGGYACLGAAVASLRRPRTRAAVFAAAVAWLAVLLTYRYESSPAGDAMLSADVAHLLALPVGYALAGVTGRPPRPGPRGGWPPAAGR